MNRTVSDVTLSEFRQIGEAAAKKAVADLRSAGLLDSEPTGPGVDRSSKTATTGKRPRTKQSSVKLVEDPLVGLLGDKKTKYSYRKVGIKKRNPVASIRVERVEKEKA